MSMNNVKERNYTSLIWILSAVAVIIILSINYIPRNTTNTIFGIDISILPFFNALFNGIAFIFLIGALITIRKGNVNAHRNFIFAAFGATFLFLLTYLTYHTLAGSTSYGGDGVLKYVYYIILISHILLSTVLLPLALFTLTRGLKMETEKHKRLARWTMPIWLYVSVSGVLVYLLISPYY